MKSKSLLDVAKTDSLALTAVITYWKDYDKNTVILSYLELKRRNFNIEPNIQKKLNDFLQKQGESIEESVAIFKKEKNIENYEEYYSEAKTIIDAENAKKEIIEKPIIENSAEHKNNTIFTTLNICLFLGLCIGCYLPIKYLIQSNSGSNCSDEEVKMTVISILKEKGLPIEPQNENLKNIITTGKK